MTNRLKKPVALIGWSGYSGQELAKLVLAHPQMELAGCFSRSADQNLRDLLPAAPDVPLIPLEDLAARAGEFDTLFFATPHEVSADLIPRVQSKKVKLIDLSGSFRLHKNEGFTYGLQPWQPTLTSWVANPGCYVTSVLMALIPLLKSKLIEADSLVIDAKSGATGAGKSAKTELLFSEVEGNCLPYKIGCHQHLPEITHYLKSFSGVETQPFFTTHLMPFKRGIISGIYARTSAKTEDITSAFSEAYANYPLVKFQSVDDGGRLMNLNQVVGSARTHLSYKIVDQQLYLFSCIDNLMKGAASQAIENWNVLHDLSPSTSLEVLQ
jgi:N-acetyl-gamma-glutamyl-phosphate reductase